jgi:spermidine synthase
MKPVPLWLLVLLQAVVSAASLVVEIVAGRMLAPYVGMSLYTWTSVIAVVLAGFSAGHWWGGLLAERPAPRAIAATGWALAAAAITTALATHVLRLGAPPVLATDPSPVVGITALTMIAFFLPSLFAGIPAPVLTKIALESGTAQGKALGAMFASGAIGAIAGTLLAGFVFVSWLGSTATLAVVTAVYLAGAVLCLGLARRLGKPALVLMASLGLLGWHSLRAPGPCTVESRYFCIAIHDVSAQTDSPVRMMVLDHLVHGISARDLPQVMFTDHAAMLDRLARLRAGPDRFSSFHIGGGNYALPRSFAASGQGPVTVAEIDPAVTRVAAESFWFDPAGARVLHEDARRTLARLPDRYDVIIGDAFTDTAVPQHLVTREFFAEVAHRLEPGGSFLMNVIDYADSLRAVGSLAATLQAVFPHVELWTEARRPEPGERIVMVLVAGDRPTPLDSFTVPSPDATRFAALAPAFVDQIAARGLVLTDDYAPIDRLVGARD